MELYGDDWDGKPSLEEPFKLFSHTHICVYVCVCVCVSANLMAANPISCIVRTSRLLAGGFHDGTFPNSKKKFVELL